MLKSYTILMLTILCSCQYGKFIQFEKVGSIDLLLENSYSLHRIAVDDKIIISVWDNDNVSLGSIFSIYSSHETIGKWALVDSLGNVTRTKFYSMDT